MTTSCIDTNTLASYFGGTISEEERVRMVAHLGGCPECLEDFASASHIMREPDPDERVPAPFFGKKLIENIYNWIKDRLTTLAEKFPVPYGEPAFAVRGKGQASGDFDVLTNYVGDLQIEISVEERKEDRTDIRVSIKNPELAKNISLALRRDGEDISECILKGSHTTFDDLLLGCYELILEENAVEKGSVCFDLGDSGIVLKSEV